jgi:adenylate cyclase
MTDDIRQRFAQGVVDRFHTLNAPVAKSLRTAAFRESASMPVGHPDFHGLDLGDSATCDVAVAFIDMSRFTARSFWEPRQQVTRLALAVLTQVALVVQESGGFVLGLRGDGVMAGWGHSASNPDVDVAMCLAACAVALDSGQNALNAMLAIDGIEPVQLRAGVDHGPVDFVRTGTDRQSEVNVVGHAANFAAKCEKYANSWEVVLGEGAGSRISARELLSPHDQSPKRYQYRGQRRTYDFFDFAWSRIVNEGVSAIRQVKGAPTSAITVAF